MGVSLFVAIVYITINFIVDVLYGVDRPAHADHMSVAPVPASAACDSAAGSCPRGSAWRSPLAIVGHDDRRRLDRDRDLRAADRAVRSAGAGLPAVLQAPSRQHLFGTDELGRDVLQPGPVRRAAVAARWRSCSSGWRSSSAATLGGDRRLLRRVRRRPDHAHDRPRVRVPGDHPRDGRRRRRSARACATR